MKNKRILISGASITGPTLAYWLNQYGFEVTIVEKSDALRLGGQNIDVKGPAQIIARKMGIEGKIRAANTTEVGIRFVSNSGKFIAEFPKDGPMSMTQELEILRGDLVQILYDCTKENVEYRFGNYITRLTQLADQVEVGFASGRTEIYDIVISAEGIGSQTRKLAFGGQPEFNYLGIYNAYLTIAKTAADSQWARWVNAPTGIVYMFRPDNYGQTRASVAFLAQKDQYKGLSLVQQKEALIKRIEGSGPDAERLTNEIRKTSDLYFERVSQVEAARWSIGNFVLAGDCAWCATPVAGKGTDLAMAGAYILAGEIYIAENCREAFEVYEKKMRPYVEACQQLPPGIPRLVYPTSKLGIATFNTVVAAAGSKLGKRILSMFSAGDKESKAEIDLPDY